MNLFKIIQLSGAQSLHLKIGPMDQMILKDNGSPTSWWTLWAYAQISPLLQLLPKEKGTVVERKGLIGN